MKRKLLLILPLAVILFNCEISTRKVEAQQKESSYIRCSEMSMTWLDTYRHIHGMEYMF